MTRHQKTPRADMTVAEFAKLGGEKIRELYGREHFRRLGQKSAIAKRAKKDKLQFKLVEPAPDVVTDAESQSSDLPHSTE